MKVEPTSCAYIREAGSRTARCLLIFSEAATLLTWRLLNCRHVRPITAPGTLGPH